MGEDLVFNIEYLKRCSSLSISQECLYYYCIRKSSATGKFQVDRIQTVVSLNNVVNEYFCKVYQLSICKPVFQINKKKVDSAFCELVISKLYKQDILQIYRNWCKDSKFVDYLQKLQSNSLRYRLILRGHSKYAYFLFYVKALPLKIMRKIRRIIKQV